MITRDDFLKPFFAFKSNNSPMITLEMESNLMQYLTKINKFYDIYKGEMKVNSGLRSVAQNKACAGAPKSHHLFGLACDFADNNKKLSNYCMNNLDVLENIGFWVENPKNTPTWCHLQIIPPSSGHRIFNL